MSDVLDTAVMVRSDARAIGMVSAFTPGGSNKEWRTYGPASVCITYTSYTDYDDGTRVIHDARIFRAPAKVRTNTMVASAARRDYMRDAALHAAIGSIHADAND
jgi:hypothetical protein